MDKEIEASRGDFLAAPSSLKTRTGPVSFPAVPRIVPGIQKSLASFFVAERINDHNFTTLRFCAARSLGPEDPVAAGPCPP